MRKSFFRLRGLLITVALILSACNLPVGSPIPETLPATPSAAHIVALSDLTVTESALPEASPTATLTVTPTETLTPEPSATSTPEPPMAEVVRESNCRTGPGALYELVAKYPVGQKVEIVAKDLGGGYWFVKNPERPEEQCYLLAQNIRISGDTTALPKFTPLPSPTAPPYFTLTFKKFDSCNGNNFAVFTVENVGSVPFRSAYVKVINQKTGVAVEHSLNAFDLRVKCVLAKNIAPLNAGGTGYLHSPHFKWSGKADKLRAVIMICTEQNLKGTCVTQTLDIKQ